LHVAIKQIILVVLASFDFLACVGGMLSLSWVGISGMLVCVTWNGWSNKVFYHIQNTLIIFLLILVALSSKTSLTKGIIFSKFLELNQDCKNFVSLGYVLCECCFVCQKFEISLKASSSFFGN
jgi:hypothetical protein